MPKAPRAPSPPRFWQDHGVFARHNKFGTFQVPKTFLNFNEAAEQCALKVAEKQAAKGAAKKAAKHAVATQTNQKTELTKTNQAETGQETTYQKATKKAVTDEAPTVTARVLPVKSTKEEGAACEQPARRPCLATECPPPPPPTARLACLVMRLGLHGRRPERPVRSMSEPSPDPVS